MDRREFLLSTGASAAALGILSNEPVAKAAASERIRVGMVGAAGRAASLNATFASNPNCEIVAIEIGRAHV